MHRTTKRVLILTVVLFALIGSTMATDPVEFDLEAKSVTFTQESGAWYVDTTVGILAGEDVTTFDYVITVTHTRGGTLIRQTTLTPAYATNGTTCQSCIGGCSGSCEVYIGDDTLTGACARKGTKYCDEERTIKKCICGVEKVKKVLLPDNPATGDIVNLSVSLGNGPAESDTTNNDTSATF